MVKILSEDGANTPADYGVVVTSPQVMQVSGADHLPEAIQPNADIVHSLNIYASGMGSIS